MGRVGDLIEGLREALRDPKAPLLHVAIDTAEPAVEHPGPVVVMVHGIASSAATFHFVVPLVEPQQRVIAIELLGFGGSPQPEGAEYTLEEHVAALARTIRSLHLAEPFVLVGHSLGCLIGARYAATHLEHVSKLVLVSPPVYLSPAEIGDPRVRLRMAGYLQALQFFRANKEFTIARAAFVAKLLPVEHVMEITEQNWTPFVKSLEHCIESQTVISDLARVERPIEVVYGRLDEFLVPGNLAIIERMRGVTTHVVAASDHMIRKPMARVVAAAIASPPAPPAA
ncbi:alpha/beta hydrolase [Herbiconiux sp. VKM Ac-1786]|uniref:alpha/beta fold hydrolase n=1 Tax=Herbiconiux sp. VKM Ac-1786 TaxID=2783824 RepID=UPI00188AEEE2|nr:alpha/beta hydrolase [Herbiconiux sp. VKM Ac-1786]MBF4572668.1 alpha/beta hydrolase [Herbiconiux sp. VKM Ac-1786]